EEGTVGVHIAATSPLWQGVDPDAAAYLLEALWTKMEAQSVALLRYEDEAHTYVVEALISQATALSTDDLRAAGNLLSEVPDDRSISLIETEALLSLKYHAHPDEAVGSGAALALNIPDARVLLVADQAKDGEPFDEEQLALLGSYADLLSRLFTERRVEGEDLPEVPARTEAIRPIEAKPAKPEPPAPRKEAALNEAEETWPPVRPRSAILADEMAEARKEERPLAFALVVPEGVETLASGTAEAVAEAETQLFGRLHRVEGTARVERFGELLAGVFCYAGPAFVEAWATRVGNSGESVHIGVALLRARHTDPEMLRADAAAALREAYERGEPCVIVE
ncbi:MAG: hypothetical protein HKN04_13405, partial [Rhodothermaceae bacterium]|nr:hypothetical protein [Rhodothermaceae bacterium]